VCSAVRVVQTTPGQVCQAMCLTCGPIVKDCCVDVAELSCLCRIACRGALRGFTQSFKSRAGTASQRSLASHDGARTSTRTSTGSAVARATSALLGRVASVRGPAGMTSNLGAGAAATAAGLPVAGGSQGEGVLASERRTRSNSLGDLLEPPPKKGCAPSVCGCVIC
jgi:hypothetical protein